MLSVNDANFVLTDTSLTRSTGGSFTLSGIKRVTLGGGPSNNTIDASGFSGNAWLYGGAGDDTLSGGSGDDYLDGGTGIDTLDGGAGDDVLLATSSTNATLTGGAGDDLIYGSGGAGPIDAGAGRDRVYASDGNDFVSGGDGDDILDGGPGSDTIGGDAGGDLIVGGAGHDTLYAFNPSGVGDDGAINYVYGDFGTAGNEPGTGNDTIVGGSGNDLLFGEGGTNTISGGGPGATDQQRAGRGTAGYVTHSNSADSRASPLATRCCQDRQRPCPRVCDYRGRWTEYSGSATGGGLSNSPATAIEPSMAAGVPGQFVAWADARTGTFQIYVALHGNVGWQELADSTHGGGISNADSPGAAAQHRARRRRTAGRGLDPVQRRQQRYLCGALRRPGQQRARWLGRARRVARRRRDQRHRARGSSAGGDDRQRSGGGLARFVGRPRTTCTSAALKTVPGFRWERAAPAALASRHRSTTSVICRIATDGSEGRRRLGRRILSAGRKSTCVNSTAMPGAAWADRRAATD